ncbi:MAG TPA: tRNA (adenosine(37)-N6)-threonylcarbamoyltransferase complex ATPase subunit type 1 TsaE [Flavisolibacter sp.]|nr:tRNA (adenosine(37)-N6)-threonylcarbamoyltransferase complex ATPase subunit type 1 TsaE [Flavisolibacter sp.]
MQISIGQLDQFAAAFWNQVKEAKVFLFHGQMGTGKTTTITALCQSKGVREGISSPTFSIINEYRFQEENEIRKIYHIDLYRLKDLEEMIAAGVEDCIYSGEICFVEWPQKAPELFDESVIHVLIETIDLQTRSIKILTDKAFSALSMAEQL